MTATRAAAAGGVTTLVDMPLNSIPATTGVAALEAKLAAARGRRPRRLRLLGRRRAGQRGRARRAGRRRRARLQVLPGALGRRRVPARRRGGPAPAHAHPRAARRAAARPRRARGPRGRGGDRLHGRRPRRPLPLRELPGVAAARAGERGDRARWLVLRAARRRAACTSSTCRRPSALPLLAEARGRGPAASPPRPARTTSFFAAEEIPDGATAFKCAPPIREHANRERLWAGARRRRDRPGRLRPLAVHARPEGTRGRGLPCAPGAGSRRCSSRLPVVWTEAQRRGFGARRRRALDVPRGRPARRARPDAKGASRRVTTRISWSGTRTRRSSSARTPSCTATRITPYAGSGLRRASSRRRILRGRVVYDSGSFASSRRGGAAASRAMATTSLTSPISPPTRARRRALAANDEFFAAKENLLKPGRGDLHRRQVHDARQVDGRLGDAPAPRARPRLVRRPPRPARRRSAASTSTPTTSSATSRRRARSTACYRPGAVSPAALLGAPDRVDSLSSRSRRSQGDSREPVPPSTQRRRVHPRAAQHLPRRRRRAAARPRRGGGGLRPPSPRSKRVRRPGRARERRARRSAPATCSSAPGTT